MVDLLSDLWEAEGLIDQEKNAGGWLGGGAGVARSPIRAASSAPAGGAGLSQPDPCRSPSSCRSVPLAVIVDLLSGGSLGSPLNRPVGVRRSRPAEAQRRRSGPPLGWRWVCTTIKEKCMYKDDRAADSDQWGQPGPRWVVARLRHACIRRLGCMAHLLTSAPAHVTSGPAHVLGAPSASAMRSTLILCCVTNAMGTPGILRRRRRRSLSLVHTMKQRCCLATATMSSSAYVPLSR